MSDLYVTKSEIRAKVAAAEAALAEAQRQNEARWVIWGDKVEALEQQLRAANETISELRAEIEDDNTAVREVARECRLDDERTIAQQAATINTLESEVQRLKLPLKKLVRAWRYGDCDESLLDDAEEIVKDAEHALYPKTFAPNRREP
jgi:hypothetical protein